MIDEVFPSAGDATSDQLQTQPMANTHLVPGCVPGYENLRSRIWEPAEPGAQRFDNAQERVRRHRYLWGQNPVAAKRDFLV